MPPVQYPAPQPQQQQPSPYDFFVEQQSPQKKQLFGGNKFILTAIIAIITLVLVGIAAVIATSGGQDSTPLVSVARKQHELSRVATEGSKNSRDTDIRNFSSTTLVTMRSSQKELVSYIAKQGTKLDDKQLALGRNAKTDQALSAAQAANTYDVTFTSTMQSELDAYVNRINEASAVAPTRAEKALLLKQRAGAELLQKMLPQQ